MVSNGASDEDELATASIAARRHSTPPPALARGALVGRFVVLELAGIGGMARLYRAFDPKLDRAVALKLLDRAAPPSQAEASPEEESERLLSEAKTLARLSHPNVVAVFDAGIFADQVFIAMEFVDGVTLRAWLRTKPRLEAVVRAFAAASEGLAAAHAAGLIHRDFKPENVIVGNDGRVRVVDFGLARDADDRDAAAPNGDGATATADDGRAIVGTPHYMAPEQYEGGALDARTDQFAFCVALHEAVYGVHPFRGTTRGELRRAIREGDRAPLPSTSRVPRWLRAVIERGLARDPRERFESMAKLRAELDRGLAGPSRRALGAVVFGALAIASVTGYAVRRAPELSTCDDGRGALAGVWDGARRDAVHAAFTRTGRPFADATFASVAGAFDSYATAWAAMRTDACRATRERHEQSEELLDLRMQCLAQRRESLKAEADLFATADDEVLVRASHAAERLPPLAVCADSNGLRAKVRAPDDPSTRARIASVRAELASITALRGAAKFDEAMPRVLASLQEAESIGYAPLTAEALVAVAGVKDGAGKYDEAATTYHRAAVTARTAGDEGLAAEAWLRLAFVTGERLSRYGEAQKWADYAEETMRRNPAASPMLGEVLRTRGVLFFLESKYEQALASTRQALAWTDQDGRRSPLLEASCLADLADTLTLLSRYDESRLYYERSIALLKQKLGPTHPDVAVQMGNLGRLLRLTGDAAKSLDAHLEALAIQEAALGPSHPNLVVNIVNSAESLLELGRPHEARLACDRALAIAHGAGSEGTLAGAYIDEVRSFALTADGDVAGGVAAAERSIATYDRIAEPGDEDVVSPLLALAEARLRQGDAARALPPLLRALPMAEKHPEEAYFNGKLHFAFARAVAASGGASARAHDAAKKAQSELASAGNRGARELVAVEAWLATHRDAVREGEPVSRR